MVVRQQGCRRRKSELQGRGLEREAGGLPGGEATSDLADVGEMAQLQEAGGDRGTVATGTIDEQRAMFGKQGEIFEEMVEGQIEAAGNALFLALAGRADIDDKRGPSGSNEFGGISRAEVLGGDQKIGTSLERAQTIFEIPGEVVEADASETNGGFIFARRVGDDHDGLAVIEDSAGPGGVLTVEANIDAADEMGRSEFVRIAGIENLRAVGLKLEDSIEG